MPLAQLMSMPRTPAEMQAWQFANMANHRDINRRVLETLGVDLPDYPLEPFDPNSAESLQNFLNLHQDVHQALDKALGLNSYALAEVDWQDPSALAQWIAAHFVEHQAASQLLGVS